MACLEREKYARKCCGATGEPIL